MSICLLLELRALLFIKEIADFLPQSTLIGLLSIPKFKLSTKRPI